MLRNRLQTQTRALLLDTGVLPHQNLPMISGLDGEDRGAAAQTHMRRRVRLLSIF